MRGVKATDWELYVVERRRLELVTLHGLSKMQKSDTPAALRRVMDEVVARLGPSTIEQAIAWVAMGRPSLSRKLTVRSV